MENKKPSSRLNIVSGFLKSAWLGVSGEKISFEE